MSKNSSAAAHSNTIPQVGKVLIPPSPKGIKVLRHYTHNNSTMCFCVDKPDASRSGKKWTPIGCCRECPNCGIRKADHTSRFHLHASSCINTEANVLLDASTHTDVKRCVMQNGRQLQKG